MAAAAGDDAIPEGAVELSQLTVESAYGVSSIEVLRAKQAFAWSQGRASDEVQVSEICATGPGITGWSKSYDTLYAKRITAKREPKPYETAFNEQKFDECVRITRELTDPALSAAGGAAPDPLATFYLARCIEGGTGCENDPATAEEMFKSAVAQLTPLAVKGDCAAQFAVAECHYNGYGVEENEKIGMMWYRSAALGEHEEALWAAKAFKLL